MIQGRKHLWMAGRSAVIAGGVSFGVLVGKFAGECLSERGVCSFNNPTLWLYWAVAFAGAWIVIAAATWALDWDRRKRQR